MSRFIAALALLLGVAGAAAAAELRPFTAGSLAAIQARFAGQPFILTLWSLECHHCAKELQLLGRLVREERTPGVLPQGGFAGPSGRSLPLAIVSTDSPAEAKALRAALRRHGLERLDTWVFDDAVPQRLRYAIDPAWHGELPRSYLYDAAHRREAHSGLLGEARLKAWLKQSGH